MTTCTGCGAAGDECEELFHRLLVLDFSRQAPWSPLHAVSVSCYFFQHPERAVDGGPAFYWSLLHMYLRDGVEAMRRGTERARHLNSHRYGGRKPTLDDFPGAPPFPEAGPPPTAYAVTIVDVAVDGTFPAEGFEEREQAWAGAAITAWSDRILPRR
ncbi:hypothetical protein FE391_22415 [Nonomuraea sp. KC401]|uniref:DUF5946 family protein n=1 Tax=unclassified Nonomuraea TaxID=2593643 RepID=UPI0010FEFDB3|nr:MULTISPECIES: DUF5946 family protein [unclassified Nonomuraea]NBE96629.1 hypothetical protein [Nonomuraea sp. K271]TLF68343.1 hypothetical protein FE391_22415 [Nonomuraea sp. KC401]